MKATGTVRSVDNLGSIATPKEIRLQMDIQKRDPLKVYMNKGSKFFIPYYTSVSDERYSLFHAMNTTRLAMTTIENKINTTEDSDI